MTELIELQKHIRYIRNSWKCFPDFYLNSESNRQTLLYFVLGALDILDELDNVFKPQEKKELVDWIYGLQIMYCDPEIPDFGATSYGWRGFGGLMFSSRGSLIPQYNLEAAWKRQLAPKSGMDQGLLFSAYAETAYRHRIPGHYSHDVNSETVMNRNLICVNSVPGELYIVKEHSLRKSLEVYDIQNIEPRDTFPQFLRHCDPEPLYTFEFNDQIAELRTSLQQETCSLFVRSRSKLTAVDQQKNLKEIFKGSVVSWEQSQLIPEELVVLAGNNKLWSGSMSQSLGRTKTIGEIPLRAVTYSDHPRVIFAADDLNIRTIDLRCDSEATSSLIFCSPGFSEELYETAYYKQEETLSAPTWTHIKMLPDQGHSLLAVSTYGFFLVDDRVPGRPMLRNNHCLLHGVHFLTAGRPVADPHGDGQQQSFYLLDQFCTGVWKMEIYKHKTEDWSAVRPLHGVPDPNDKNLILRNTKIAKNYVYPPTRGIAVTTLEKKGKHAEEILFRYLDDSSVMFKTYYYGLNGKEAKQMEMACLDRNDVWEKVKAEIEVEELTNIFGEGMMMPGGARSEIIDIEPHLPEKDYSIRHQLNPLLKEIVQTESLEPLEPYCSLKGFRGSHTLSAQDGSPPPGSGDGAQLSQTYSALCSLIILGDDLSLVDRTSILKRIKESQNEEGSFWSQGEGSECDMRYVYIAVAICHILKDDTVIDWDRLKKFMRQALRFDGGIGQGYDDESHGGSTYCAIAALALSNRLWDYSVYTEKEIRKLIRWAIYKQDEGMHGRAHKEDDCCYAFWIGATLKILNSHQLLDLERLRRFLCKAQHKNWGGFCKLIGTEYSDILHTYFSLAALSLMKEPTFSPINPALNVTRRAYEHLLHIQNTF